MGKEEEKFEIIENAKAGKLQITGIVFAIAILAGMFLVPVGENFPVPARNTLGVLLAVIVLLVTEALPLGIVCLMSAAFLYFFHCTDSVQGAFSGYTNPTLFFVLASYGISSALTKVSVTRRFLLTLMRKFGQNTRRLMLTDADAEVRAEHEKAYACHHACHLPSFFCHIKCCRRGSVYSDDPGIPRRL